jgi:hypothetical protein
MCELARLVNRLAHDGGPMPYDEEEPQRFLGFPVARGFSSWRITRDDTRPRVMGIPRVEYTGKPLGKPLDLRWVRSPIRWMRWRREVRKQGPYAARFDDFC